MKKIKLLLCSFSLLLLQACGGQDENFLIGDWAVDVTSLPEELRDSRLASLEFSFTEDTATMSGGGSRDVNYEIDGDHIAMYLIGGNMPEEEYLHYYLVDENTVRADLSGMNIDNGLILKRKDSE